MPALDQGDADLLIAEIHHRFSNSLQVISALARQCERTQHDPDQQNAIFADMVGRLESFARVHRELSIPSVRASFEKRCLGISKALVGAFGREDDVHVRADSHDLSDDSEDRLLLVVAELVTNALKHSLHGRVRGVIEIRLCARPGALQLFVSDSARTPVADPGLAPSRIVSALAASMGGHAYVDDRNGYTACVSLPSGDDDPVMLPLEDGRVLMGSVWLGACEERSRALRAGQGRR